MVLAQIGYRRRDCAAFGRSWVRVEPVVICQRRIIASISNGKRQIRQQKKNLHFRLLVRTAEDVVGGGVYLHWWSEPAAGEPNSEGGCIPRLYEYTAHESGEKPRPCQCPWQPQGYLRMDRRHIDFRSHWQREYVS